MNKTTPAEFVGKLKRQTSSKYSPKFGMISNKAFIDEITLSANASMNSLTGKYVCYVCYRHIAGLKVGRIGPHTVAFCKGHRDKFQDDKRFYGIIDTEYAARNVV